MAELHRRIAIVKIIVLNTGWTRRRTAGKAAGNRSWTEKDIDPISGPVPVRNTVRNPEREYRSGQHGAKAP